MKDSAYKAPFTQPVFFWFWRGEQICVKIASWRLARSPVGAEGEFCVLETGEARLCESCLCALTQWVKEGGHLEGLLPKPPSSRAF